MKLKSTQTTYVPTDKDLEKKYFLVDVKGMTLGQTAVKIADLLRGKGKPHFNPQHDCGDYIVAINAKHIRLAGNKLDKKLYHWHTRYPGGFRTRTARELLEAKPEKVLYDAVWGMLPRTRIRKHLIRKFRVFPETEHTHKAQNPQLITL